MPSRSSHSASSRHSSRVHSRSESDYSSSSSDDFEQTLLLEGSGDWSSSSDSDFEQGILGSEFDESESESTDGTLSSSTEDEEGSEFEQATSNNDRALLSLLGLDHATSKHMMGVSEQSMRSQTAKVVDSTYATPLQFNVYKMAVKGSGAADDWDDAPCDPFEDVTEGRPILRVTRAADATGSSGAPVRVENCDNKDTYFGSANVYSMYPDKEKLYEDGVYVSRRNAERDNVSNSSRGAFARFFVTGRCASMSCDAQVCLFKCACTGEARDGRVVEAAVSHTKVDNDDVLNSAYLCLGATRGGSSEINDLPLLVKCLGLVTKESEAKWSESGAKFKLPVVKITAGSATCVRYMWPKTREDGCHRWVVADDDLTCDYVRDPEDRVKKGNVGAGFVGKDKKWNTNLDITQLVDFVKENMGDKAWMEGDLEKTLNEGGTSKNKTGAKKMSETDKDRVRNVAYIHGDAPWKVNDSGEFADAADGPKSNTDRSSQLVKVEFYLASTETSWKDTTPTAGDGWLSTLKKGGAIATSGTKIQTSGSANLEFSFRMGARKVIANTETGNVGISTMYGEKLQGKYDSFA